MRVRRHVVVHGRVQGVYFRQGTRDRAVAVGAGGWVRNNPDGSVEAVVEGTPQAVREMLAFLRIGPPDARVDEVRERAEEPAGERAFRVL